jgi:peptidoglycan/LPS O-acetylase OafA/YrhL
VNARLAHLPALDGLRGLALLGVLFFHAQGALPGGYLGVDLFFVLSGFLITSLLLAEHEATKRIDLGAFWIRRARRLFPALLSLMPAIAIYAWVVAKPDELARLRSEALATLAYVANWRAVFAHESYWELFTSPSPLEHTWSLAIEEQFYVVWPLLVWLVLKRATRRSILAMSVALAVASMIAMWFLSNAENTARAYMGTDTRATAILSGAALAAIVKPGTTFDARAARILDVLGVIALIGLGYAWLRLDGTSSFLYRGGFWATEACALVLVLCAMAGSRSLVARALAFRPLAYIGTISYGLYLWHWPVDCVVTAQRLHLHGAPLVAIQLAITFAIAIASFHFYERPIRSNGVPFGRPAIVVPAAIAVALVLVVRSTHARKPIERPLPPAAPIAIEAADAGPPFTIMVLGDSTANSLGWALRGVREPGVAIELRGKDSCTMLWDTCGGETWQSLTKEVHPDVTLVYVGGAFLHGLSADGRWRQACYKKWDAQFEKTLATRLVGLSNEATRAYVVTVPYPVGPYDSAPWREKVDCINAQVRKAASEVPEVRVLELGERFCPKGKCEYEHAGFTVRPDGVHYDIDGANGIAKWVLEQIRF